MLTQARPLDKPLLVFCRCGDVFGLVLLGGDRTEQGRWHPKCGTAGPGHPGAPGELNPAGTEMQDEFSAPSATFGFLRPLVA